MFVRKHFDKGESNFQLVLGVRKVRALHGSLSL